ncbi:AMP-binding protein [Algiphilus sp.]|uniref:AMP-binding protein n=1 Tax=Algiphilus sp. TaxID=1872431 RepID=UPI003C47DA85
MSEHNELILGHIVADWVERDPDRTILTFVQVAPDGSLVDETRTYREIQDNAHRIAGALQQDAGMARGSRFAIMMQNHPEFVDTMVASSIADTVFVPIDPRTQGQKLRYMLDFAECEGIVTADYALPQVLAVVKDLPRIRWVWVVGDGVIPDGLPGVQRMADILARPVPDLPMLAQDPTAPMQMLYTSGTTGDPKAILSPYARFGGIASLGPALGLREDDRPYTGLSLTHANAQLITLGNALKMGTPAVFSRKFTKSRLWDITRHYGCTMFNLLGGMTTAIYSEPRKPDDADNPVRYVIAAGMPAQIWESFAERFGLEIFEFYATAEGGLCMNPPNTGPVGSIGRPPPTMVARVVDDEGNDCPPGEPGELIFQNADGTCAPVAYYKNQEASEKKTAGGWFRSGDIGSVDADGWYYFHHRKGSAIRHNGDFINPAYVEKAMAEHDAVDDVYVYGVTASNGVAGEKDVVAAIVPAPGVRVDPAALFAHCRATLEPNFVPTYIQVMDEIPKTASEKPQERFCVEAFENHPDRVHTAPAAARKHA